jgi:uncharacterized protein (TIGR03435 family)
MFVGMKLLIGLVFGAVVLFGQQARVEAFEVAVVKRAGLDAVGRWIRMEAANRLHANNHALRTLIAAAYDLNPDAISGGPEWVDSVRWDIVAQTPGARRPTPDEQMAMLRQLLSERFKLKFHRESKVFSIYTLTVAKGGAKLKDSTFVPDSTPEGPPLLAFSLSPALVHLPARYTSMAEFASILQRSPLDRPVVNQTGLAGRYDFDLDFEPDETLWGGRLPKPEESKGPSLMTAITEQLGLQLKATRGPIDAIVIDGAARPAEN